ncbi:MAG: peptidase dimerization domain-containing protein [Solirubrobacterales bacterium]
MPTSRSCSSAAGSGRSSLLDKAATWLHVEAAGRKAHAGADPHLGRSALAALIAGPRPDRARRRRRPRRPPPRSPRLVADRPSNAIPGHVTAVVDLRAMSDEDLAWAVKEGTRFGDHDGVAFTVTDTVSLPAMESPPALTAAALEALARAGFEGGG